MSSNFLITQYNLRWPEDLKEKIVEAAKESSRSINQEVVSRLENSFETKQKPVSSLLIDVELIFFSSLPWEVNEQDFQNLVVQFPAGQIPSKGDILNIEALKNIGDNFIVKEKVYDISQENKIEYTLILEKQNEV
ncbi:Arc family DNA-binding protein [Acinetobacter sp.]|uniref:Arc family DNA-binding protein n=1 Tax=Acinetobacter sp. TaxID=472 RepID=UPI002488700A|nr:Arc family DNA-binding protein [Acinetobacter sp.]MDI1223002.1 Arc family DNA-binding protein [Acinetobacter sp.]